MVDKRFRDAFKTKAVEHKTIKGVPFVIKNSMALEGDGCFLCNTAVQSLKKVKEKLSSKNGSQTEISQPILMSHFPLFRLSDEQHCDEADEAPADEKYVQFREGWNCISKESSNLLLESLNPSVILSGHTHHGCNTRRSQHFFSHISIKTSLPLPSATCLMKIVSTVLMSSIYH
jgi:hypothetical protein